MPISTDTNTPRNWIRLTATVDAFKRRYGHVPTTAKLGTKTIDDVRENLTDQEWKGLNRILPIQVSPLSEWEIEVSDNNGNRLNYRDVTLTGGDGYRDAEVFLGDVFRGCFSVQ